MALFTKMSLKKDSEFSDGSTMRDEENTHHHEIRDEMLYNADKELKVRVYNTPDCIMIVAEVAGVSDEDLHITVREDHLEISGTSKLPAEMLIHEEHVHTEEFGMGSFSRSIILPQHVDMKQIQAKMSKERILIVTVPKLDENKEREIKIQLED